jgi:hypothetical protein
VWKVISAREKGKVPPEAEAKETERKQKQAMSE